jgi:chromosome segregation ATPase
MTAISLTNSALHMETEAVQSRIRAAESAWITANAAREDTIRENSSLREQLTAQKERAQSLRGELDAAVQETDTLRVALEALKQRANSEMSVLSGSLDDVVRERDGLRLELEHQKACVDAMCAQLAGVEEDACMGKDESDNTKSAKSGMEAALQEQEKKIGVCIHVRAHVCMYVFSDEETALNEQERKIRVYIHVRAHVCMYVCMSKPIMYVKIE